MKGLYLQGIEAWEGGSEKMCKNELLQTGWIKGCGLGVGWVRSG